MANNKTPNTTGRNAENVIDCVMQILRGKGYGVVSQYRLDDLLTTPLVSDSVRVDFFLTGISDCETGLIITSKRQNSSGTAEKSVFYELWLIEEVFKFPSILVMVGSAYHKNLRKHVRSCVGKGKLIAAFFSYEELLQWAESLPKMQSGNELKAIVNLPLFGGPK